MSNGLLNLVVVNTATSGTGTISLGSVVTPYLTMALAGAVDGRTYSYSIIDSAGGNSEVARGVWSSGANTLTRGPIKSTNSNNAISLSGSAIVRITVLAEDIFDPVSPQGRLTLAIAVPVMTTTQSAKTTVYYTPYRGQLVPLYDGTRFTVTDTGGELSQATTDNTKSPAAVTTNSNYDVFVWTDSGTIRATRGPAWTSDTGRGTGAGTSELLMAKGINLNANDITNGPAASRGTYVGTIRSNGSSQIDFIFGGIGVGGIAGIIGVWNAHNRVPIAHTVGDSTDSWTYNSQTPRAANNSAAMMVSMVRGLNEDPILVTYGCLITNGVAANGYVGVGIDSTSAFSGRDGFGVTVASASVSGRAEYGGLPGLGFHYAQAIEWCTAGNTVTFSGDAGAPTVLQNALIVHAFY